MHRNIGMSTRWKSFAPAAVLVVAAVLLAAGASSLSAQSEGKPPYDPTVEPVARAIFMELMSPY